ncbi:glycosyltransferase family 4 protein [Yinghuangia seranimata]|uniref:glycosyltransferase family 4 protein n=1 Tax=Yinghuangia seranimata TaxID=408067 RepID=UPI00248BA474|nr:glycosyltransferase family 4 protein [Yinghuangia seranimata]MDI2130188.1 glycosyltransferase family 4 protein [Yinghuangia seranimata]
MITDPRRRGAQTFAVDLHRELLARGADSSVVALAGTGAEDPLDVPALGSGRLAPATLRALYRRARRARVVVAHGSSTLPACALALAPTRVPFVYVNIGDPRHWAATPARRARVGFMLRRAAAVASVSPQGRDLLVARYGLPSARVRAIPNGRRPEAFPRVDAESRASARKELGIDQDAEVVAVVGALGPEKRVDLAVRAFARRAAASAGERVDGPTGNSVARSASGRQLPVGERLLLVAGDGTERDRLSRIADELAPDRVRFLGTVADPGRVYRAADALLLTSDSEGVPGVLVEAGLSGIPAVATDVGFVRDVVLDGETGALAPPNDPVAIAAALDRVLADRAALGDRAYDHCLATYAMDGVVDAWQDLLDALAGPAGMVDRA